MNVSTSGPATADPPPDFSENARGQAQALCQEGREEMFGFELLVRRCCGRVGRHDVAPRPLVNWLAVGSAFDPPVRLFCVGKPYADAPAPQRWVPEQISESSEPSGQSTFYVFSTDHWK